MVYYKFGKRKGDHYKLYKKLKEHHKHESFEDEFKKLLAEHTIEFKQNN